MYKRIKKDRQKFWQQFARRGSDEGS